MKTQKLILLTFLFVLLVNEAAFARAGGRSSGFGGSRSTSYTNQGSRGSRTYEGASSNRASYSGMNKSTTPANQNNATNTQNNRQNPNQNAAQQPSFFQRNPMLSTFGAVIAGTWIGNMLFGSNHNAVAGSGIDANGNPIAEPQNGGIFSGMMPIILIGLLIFFLVRMVMKKQNNQTNQENYNQNFGQGNFANNDNQNNFSSSQDINLPESEKDKFAQILIEVQSAWSDQDMERLKKSVTPEIFKYFSDALRQNQSQNLQNKVENLQVQGVIISEAWQEEDLQFATVILEWLALDYDVNIEDNSQILQGNKTNLLPSSEAWTFVRFQESGKWILSAIAQVN